MSSDRLKYNTNSGPPPPRAGHRFQLWWTTGLPHYMVKDASGWSDLTKLVFNSGFCRRREGRSDEEKHDFLPMAISINLNLAACFLKEENFFRVGQLCSMILCYDVRNVKALFRGAVAALGLNKVDLAFFDVAQAIKINPHNKEFQAKISEVVTTLGWTKDYVTDALEVLSEDDSFVSCTTNSGFDVKCKDGQRKDEDVESQSYIDGMLKPLEHECHTTPTEVNKKVVGDPFSVKGKVNPSTQESKHRFSNRHRQDSYLDITPSMYEMMSNGKELHFDCSSRKNMISVRVLGSTNIMDRNEGLARCENTPNEVTEHMITSMVHPKAASVPPFVFPPASPHIRPRVCLSEVHSATFDSQRTMRFSITPMETNYPRVEGLHRYETTPSKVIEDMTTSMDYQETTCIFPSLFHLPSVLAKKVSLQHSLLEE
ncbi:Peptidyl-prolyl cis-trans isomerase FKBP62 [Bienertia sinuspersici]